MFVCVCVCVCVCVYVRERERAAFNSKQKQNFFAKFETTVANNQRKILNQALKKYERFGKLAPLATLNVDE